MKYLIILAAALLVGCGSVPVNRKFPEAPATLLEACTPLKTLDENTVNLSEVTKSVVNNYTTYHQCVVKYNAWIEWYTKQKKIFEEMK
jgi:uncharacterized protein YcfL